MQLAVGAMASLVPKLGDLLMAQYVVQKGLKPNIESLSNELQAVNAALIDASRVPPDQLSELDKLWARQVRELSYDMEDAVDDFILRVADRESAATTDANVFKKMVCKAAAMIMKVKDRYKIAGRVRDIKKLSSELAELRAKYTVRGIGANLSNLAASTGIDPRVRNLYKKDSDLVGIEESRDKIIRMLTGTEGHADASDQRLKIVSIVGVGGLGKTTLAKTVQDMLKKRFSCCAFISIGRTPNIPRTFEKMLMELNQRYKKINMTRWDVDQFCKELHEFLHHKRYFIVIDDIWDKESWETIKHALKDNNYGSRILMTTRNFEVVTELEEVYRLKPLSYANSEKLFYKRLQSQEGQSLYGKSAEVSGKIVGKCGGVPLAIIAIASLLVKKACKDWLKIYDSIGFGNEDNTNKILAYSYYDLPSYLKPCLLHLGIFPEDTIFEINSAIWLWIGEGFVFLEKDEGSLFDVGERYFRELVNRSMIELTESKFDPFKKGFHIHDIVFDLIREMSRDENLFTIIGSRGQHASSDSLKTNDTGMPSLVSKVRRLLVQNHHVQHIPKDTMDRPEVLRSLNIVCCEIKIMASLSCFIFCRVLCIYRCNIPINLLKHIGRLLHLKYLQISDTIVDVLPKEIGYLKSLQTLLLVNIGLHELPPEVCSLTQLMCLIVYGFKQLSMTTERMGNLTSLEELWLDRLVDRRATEDFVVELSKLTRLRVVMVTFCQELQESLQKPLVRSLCNLRELQELQIVSSEFSQLGDSTWESWEPPSRLRRLLIQGIRFGMLPRWINISELPHLCFLSLEVCVVKVQDLDNLARLPELSYLHLKGWSWPPGYTVSTKGFKNLSSCYVGTALRFHMGGMPRLEELQFVVFVGYTTFELNGVPLEQFPTKDVIDDLDFGLDNLLSLEQISVVLHCLGATASEVEKVEDVVRRAVKDHPNRPTLTMDRVYEEHMISDQRREDLLQQHIEQPISVLECKDKSDAAFIMSLRAYRRLQKAIVSMDCAGASMGEVEKVEAALRHAAAAHRNHPTIQLIRKNTDKMISSYHSDTQPDDRDDSLEDSHSKLQLRN